LHLIPVQNNQATAQPLRYETPEMQMVAPPVGIDKGPITIEEKAKIRERQTVEPRFVTIVNAIKNTTKAYLEGNILPNLWSIVGKLILGFFKDIFDTFKAVFWFNEVSKQLSAVYQGIGSKVGDPIIGANMPTAAVIVMTSSPVNSNSINEEPWLDYFERELNASSPIKRQKTQERVLNAINAGGDPFKIIGDPDQYPRLYELVIGHSGPKTISIDKEPLWELQPPVAGGETTLRSPATAQSLRYETSEMQMVALPVGIDTTISITYLSERLIDLWDYFGRLFRETFEGVRYRFQPVLP